MHEDVSLAIRTINDALRHSEMKEGTILALESTIADLRALDVEIQHLYAVLDTARGYIEKQRSMEKHIGRSEIEQADTMHREAYVALIDLSNAVRDYALLQLTRLGREVES